jgi:hypothetical protein
MPGQGRFIIEKTWNVNKFSGWLEIDAASDFAASQNPHRIAP